MSKAKFSIGDRVRVLDTKELRRHILALTFHPQICGECGQIVEISKDDDKACIDMATYLIAFDNNLQYLHNNQGSLKSPIGWWVSSEEIEPINEEEMGDNEKEE